MVNGRSVYGNSELTQTRDDGNASTGEDGLHLLSHSSIQVENFFRRSRQAVIIVVSVVKRTVSGADLPELWGARAAPRAIARPCTRQSVLNSGEIPMLRTDDEIDFRRPVLVEIV